MVQGSSQPKYYHIPRWKTAKNLLGLYNQQKTRKMPPKNKSKNENV